MGQPRGKLSQGRQSFRPARLLLGQFQAAIGLAQRDACLTVEDVDEVDVVPALDRRCDRPVLRVEAVHGDDPALPVDEDFDGPDRGVEGLFHGRRRAAGFPITLRSAARPPGSRPDLLRRESWEGPVVPSGPS